ncbi:uncharacterized protein V1513DRAFT_378368 [Lipomyces chichibuensis]|uniref:uncharacterized protein n=1 Tax=Lipomyces chichibuensis TaxID=1546026 RepID=UPI0033435F6E
MRASTAGEVMWDVIERLYLEWTHIAKSKDALQQKISHVRRAYKWIKAYDAQHPNTNFFDMSRLERRKWLKDNLNVNYDKLQWIHEETYDYMKRLEEGKPVDKYDAPGQEMLSILAERERARKHRSNKSAQRHARSGSEIDTNRDTLSQAHSIFQKKQDQLSATNMQLLRAFTLAVLNEDVSPAVGGLLADWIREFKSTMALESGALRAYLQTFLAKCNQKQ